MGELGSLGRGSRQQRVEEPGNRLRWALERDEDTCAASPLPRPPVSPSAKPAPYWFTQPWKAIQIPIPGFPRPVTAGKSCNLPEPGVPSPSRGNNSASSEVCWRMNGECTARHPHLLGGAPARPRIRMVAGDGFPGRAAQTSGVAVRLRSARNLFSWNRSLCNSLGCACEAEQWRREMGGRGDW